ncbi:MAG TPA: hypothetical protein VNT53_11190 [Pseudolysinimonas sp.]|nr:hypothetical protein [Pseudolysinimonas sp.]
MTPLGSSRRVRLTLAALIGVVAAASLAACGPAAPAPAPTRTASASAPPGTSATPKPAKLDLTGSAADNKAYFDKVNTALIDAGGTLNGRAFIDSLVAAGFTKTAMQLTPDRTASNNAADNIEFSVKVNGSCLLGQWGNVGYASLVAAPMDDGRCLIGTTRPIDW